MSAVPGERDDARRAREQGHVLLNLRRPEEALAHLHRAAAMDPQDAGTRVLISAAELDLEHPQQALQAADAAIAISPETAAAHRTRALALAKLKRGKDARAAALNGCRLEPEGAISYVVLSEALLVAGDEAGALAATEQAVRCDPESFAAHNARGRMLLAHDRNGDAAAAFEQALALEPESAVALNNLSVAKARSGQHGAAISGLEQATRTDPRLSLSRRNLLAIGRPARTARRVAILFAIAAVLVAVLAGSPSRWGVVAFLGGSAILFEFTRWRSLRRLSGATRALLDDDARARRFQPARWDWRAPGRFRPWWWLLLVRMRPLNAFLTNAAVVALGVATQLWLWAAIFALGLPFSAWRVWKEWRREHPGRHSWRPPTT